MKITHSQYGPESLRRELQEHAPATQRWLVGYSGGLDSTALLAALQALQPPQPVVAIHVNHGLSPVADRWQAHCIAQCEAWGIECRVIKVSVQNLGFGVEDAAREARYQAYKEQLQTGDVLLLGHHQDDQAETLLFRLLRGAGPRGLGAIVRERPLAKAKLLRPLLSFSKAQLEAYVASRNLDWVTDDSNTDEVFDRNFLRQQIMPLLASRWPRFSERWRLTAEACQAADQLNRDLACLDLEQGGERTERWGWSVDWEFCRQLPDYRRDNLLRYWTIERCLAVIERKPFGEINKQFFGADEPASSACVRWGGAELRYYQGRIYLLKALPLLGASAILKASAPINWRPIESQLLPGGGCLQVEPADNGLRVAESIELRWRQGGERCRPVGRRHSQTLKKLLQEYALEPWLRDRVPLLYVDGELAAVGDLWVCEGFQAQAGETGLRLEWRLG